MRLPTLLTFATAVVLASACSGSSSFTVGGEKITNLDTAIAAVESEFRGDVATDDSVAVADDARCYFLTTHESEIDLRAFCGPIGFYDADGPFNVYRLEAYPVDDGVELGVGGRDESGVTVRDTASLVRPDNESLPDELFVAPPALAPDALLNVDQLPFELSGGFDDTALIRFPEMAYGDETGEFAHARIVALTRTPTVGDGYTRLSAAEGHELVVVQLEHDTLAEISVLVDGNRRLIEDIYAHSRYHIISVPEGSSEAALEFRHHEVVQTLSLTDGSRGGSAPAVWYREDVSARIDHNLVGTYDGHYTRASLNGDTTYDFSLSFETNFTDGELVHRDGNGKPAPPGKVWLAVNYEYGRYSDNVSSIMFQWSYMTNPTLRLDDGTAIEPSEVLGSGAPRTAYFAVDEDFTNGTLALSTDVAWQDGVGTNVNEHGEATLDVEEVTFELS